MFISFFYSELSLYELLFGFVNGVIFAAGIRNFQAKKAKAGNNGPRYHVGFHSVFNNLVLKVKFCVQALSEVPLIMIMIPGGNNSN